MAKRNIRTLARLSPRQRECASILAIGYSPHQIAAALGLKERTVSYHLFCARERLRVATLPELVYSMCIIGELPIDHPTTRQEIDQVKGHPFAYVQPAALLTAAAPSPAPLQQPKTPVIRFRDYDDLNGF